MRGYYVNLDRWAGDTRWMSAIEEGVYVRLLQWALKNESDLPLEVAECYRIAVATNAAEKTAVRNVLEHAFVSHAHGRSSETLKSTLADWMEKKPAVEARRENTKARVERWRKKQQQAAKAMHERGQAYDSTGGYAGMEEQLGKEFTAVDNAVSNPEEGDEAVTRYVTRYEAVTEDVTNASRDALKRVPERVTAFASLTLGAREGEGPGTAAGSACRAMRRVGLVGVNPSHPSLLALLAAGATEDHFAAVAASAVARDKGFGWVLAVVEGQLRDGAKTTAALADRKHAQAATLAEQIAPELFAPK